MSRDKRYQRLLNSQEWRGPHGARVMQLQRQPLCEECLCKGYVRAAVDVHHIVPVESAGTLAEMRALCFSPGNLRSLCVECHTAIHRDMGRGTRSQHADRQGDRLARWVERHTKGNDKTK